MSVDSGLVVVGFITLVYVILGKYISIVYCCNILEAQLLCHRLTPHSENPLPRRDDKQKGNLYRHTTNVQRT